MDNTPIHTSKDVDELVLSKGYKCVYLPPYSPQLNPIEQFWSVLKNKVKRSEFGDKYDLKLRITVACGATPFNHFEAFIQHSDGQFEKGLAMSIYNESKLDINKKTEDWFIRILLLFPGVYRFNIALTVDDMRLFD